MTKRVSIIIPCRNEERFIGECLDSVLAQDYPQDQIEIFIADGMSTDRTREILDDYAKRYSFIRWLDNPRKIVSTGLNILIGRAEGDFIIRLDVHADYPQNYISQCVKYIIEYQVDNVGGFLNIKPGNSTLTARAIALAISRGFGAGNASFKTGAIAPKFVDTVPFGCFQRDVFKKVGLFDEDLIRNQDDEFNSRIIKNGGKVLLVPEIIINYYARQFFTQLWRMNYQYGYFKPLTAIKLGKVMTWRQLAPALFIISLAMCGIGFFFYPVFHEILAIESVLYLLVNFTVSAFLASQKGILLFPFLVASFCVIHFGYGMGYLRGIFDFIILKKNTKKKIQDMKLSR
ncbi:MAG: glycosyltransferase family 2 protein [Candidatus Omnitrophica bacterium]|nr:glycosyltransferase family 2 protein [Candidatus Omnitrophota bacterium]